MLYDQVMLRPVLGYTPVTSGLVLSIVKVIQVELPKISLSTKTYLPSPVMSVHDVYVTPLSVAPDRESPVNVMTTPVL